jgi:hypothetical protein
VVCAALRPVYNCVMPFDPITAAIVNAVVTSAVSQLAALPPPSASTTGIQTTAMPRVLPKDTKRGQLVVSGPTSGQIDGQNVILSPAVQIRDPFNLRVLPGMIRQPVPVRYQTDLAGFVTNVWILSDQEAAQP